MFQTTFLLGIHNHQPIGNFPEIFEMGYRKAYYPFLEVMKEYPDIKWSLHLSGILWDFIIEKHPEYVEDVKKMVERGQLELLSGGYYEPILAVIPDRDKLSQIKKLNDFIKDTFGQTPRGVWLTERIWEPSLPKVLNDAGIEYTLVDDYHFLSSGYDPDGLTGYYVTEESGCKIDIFPISQKLRYYIPFEEVEKSIDLFKSNGKFNSSLTMGDDGEKFGMWPKTYEHVYGKSGSSKSGWLNKFLNAIKNSGAWLKTATFSEFLKTKPATGRIYLPTTSYFEMSEWSLPSGAQSEMERVVENLSRINDGAIIRKYVRGGFWRNFLTKYDESNNMHKKMLYVSEKIAIKGEKEKKRKRKKTNKTQSPNLSISQSLEHLYAAQCNCAYWHGVFGGLYLPHLRRAVYEELIRAEKHIAPKKADISLYDINKDGRDEIIYESPSQNLYVSPHSGGVVYEWDIMDPPVNVLNVLTRRYEAYHKKLKEYAAKKESGLSIHDITRHKEKNLENYLNYDWYNRASLIDHFIHPDTKFEDFTKCKYGEQGDFAIESYQHEINNDTIKLSRNGKVWINDNVSDVLLEKIIKPGADCSVTVNYRIKNLSGENASFTFGSEQNFAFFAGFGKTEEDGITEREFIDSASGIKLILAASSPFNLWAFPIETISLSEDGFERTLQGGCILISWKFELSPQETKNFEIKFFWQKT